MSRLVDPKPPGAGFFAKGDRDDAVKEYLERVAKYVPAEIIAAYLTALPIISGTTKDGDDLRTGLYIVMFLTCLVLTPFYFRFMAQPGQPRRLHMIVSGAAFIVWAYSLGGIFADLDLFHEAIASIGLIIFSLISGLIAPTEGTP